MKLAIFATHPIQYHIPWYQELSRRPGVDVKVYFACIPGAEEQGTGFDVAFNWDIPLLEGYQWEVLTSKQKNNGLKGFFSCRVLGLAKLLRWDRPDVVLLTGWQALPLLQVLLWCVLLGIPRIVRGESNGLKPRSRKVRLIHSLLLRRYQGFLTIGKANRQFYTGYGVSEEKLFPCPYFVDNTRFFSQIKHGLPQREELREKWSIPQESTCFMYVGKLIKKKRIQDQLDALKIALKKNANLYLLVVGTGELMESAQQKVYADNLPVSFVGFLNQTEITNAYGAADCLILSSDYDETWGLVVNEAMVCGLPAIVSDRAGCGPDLIEEGITGSLYPFGDTQALAARVLYMAENQERLLQMGKNAQRRVLQHYTVRKAVKGTLAAVENVAGQAIA